MKYIITAKNIKDNLSVTDPCKRTEIATELISTRLKALVMLENGLIDKTDVIVTRIDRKCLYDQIFDNVIDWNEFLKLDDEALVSADIIDLVKDICDGSIDSSENFHEAFPVIPESVFNISLDYDRSLFSAPFVCLLIRAMDNDPEKNLSAGFWMNLIMELKKERIQVFVFGDVDSSIMAPGNVCLIRKFIAWCSLLSNKNCKAVISTCSGGVYPVFFTGHENSKLFIIDNEGLIEKHKDSPSFYNNCINFKNVKKIVYLDDIPREIDLIRDLKDYAGI